MTRYRTYGALDDRVIEDIDAGYIGFNNRLRADQLTRGILSDSRNGRIALNQEWSTRSGVKPVPGGQPFTFPTVGLILPSSSEITDTDPTVAVLPHLVTAVAVSGTNITLTVPNHMFSVDDVLTLSGIPFSTTDPNGSITVTNSVKQQADPLDDTIRFTLASPDGSYAVAPVLPIALSFALQNVTTSGALVGSAILSSSKSFSITDSISYSDPSVADGSQYILLVANNECRALNLQTNTSSVISYPSQTFISDSSSALQIFNKVIIFRDNATALVWDGDFTDASTPGNGFVEVSKGDFTYPAAHLTTAFLIAKGEAKGTKSGHGYVRNDTIQVTIIGSSGLTLNQKFTVSRVNGDDFFFFVDNAPDVDASAVSTKPTFIKQLPSELGYTHMPAAPFGQYFQRRLVLPFQYDVSDSGYTDRKIRDEIIFSDILDHNTYDQIFATFRLNAGTSDFIVGMQPFSEDNLIVFNRNSIHLVSNTTVLAEAKAEVLTDEIGCLARNTIQQVGNAILFLSDNGVYSVNFIEGYQLRGSELPLSESVDFYIKNINKLHSVNSQSVYFNNRYYLAAPFDYFKNSENNKKYITRQDALDDGVLVDSIIKVVAEENNGVLVYNFLNKSWESFDYFENEKFFIDKLLVAGNKDNRALYISNKQGGIHLYESDSSGIDQVQVDVPLSGSDPATSFTNVRGLLSTRMFNFKNLDIKKFNQFDIHAESTDTEASFSLSADFENPDITAQPLLTNKNIPKDEDLAIRGRIGNIRGYGCKLKIQSTGGRPAIKSLKVQATESSKSVQDFE